MAPDADGKTPIFRAEAVAAAGGGNRLNTLSPIISAKMWIVTAALAFLLAMVVLWSFAGRIPLTVAGTGIFLRGERMDTCNARTEGYVTEVRKREGDRVVKGECVAVLSSGSTAKDDVQVEVRSPVDGRVIAMEVEVGDFVSPGAMVAVVASGAEKPMCVAFVALSEGRSIEIGMPVRVEFAASGVRSSAHAMGKVSQVEKFITSSEKMFGRVPSASFVEAVRSQFGPVMVVTTALDVDSSGRVLWDSAADSSDLLVDGTQCDIEVTIGTFRPAALVMPGLDSEVTSQASAAP